MLGVRRRQPRAMLGMSQPLLYIPNPFSFPQRPPEKDTTTPPPQPFPVYVSTDSFSGLVSQRNIGRREKKYPKGSWRGCSQAKAGSEVASSRGGAGHCMQKTFPPLAPSWGEGGCEGDARSTGAADHIPADTAASHGGQHPPATTLEGGGVGCL